jgi:hypothetical protein
MKPIFTAVPVAGFAGPKAEAAAAVVALPGAVVAVAPEVVGDPAGLLLELDLLLLQAATAVSADSATASMARRDLVVAVNDIFPPRARTDRGADPLWFTPYPTLDDMVKCESRRALSGFDG